MELQPNDEQFSAEIQLAMKTYTVLTAGHADTGRQVAEVDSSKQLER